MVMVRHPWGKVSPTHSDVLWWPWLHDHGDRTKQLRLGRQSDEIWGPGFFWRGRLLHPETHYFTILKKKKKPDSTLLTIETQPSFFFPSCPFSAGRICQFSACHPAGLRILKSKETRDSDVIRTSPICNWKYWKSVTNAAQSVLGLLRKHAMATSFTRASCYSNKVHMSTVWQKKIRSIPRFLQPPVIDKSPSQTQKSMQIKRRDGSNLKAHITSRAFPR